MVTFGSTLRYFVYRGDVDMRKSFDGLQGLINNHMGRNGMNGEVFVFFNRRRTQVKMLVWDRTGFVIYYKRLERGSFEKPKSTGRMPSQSISWSDLQMILEGVKLENVQYRKRYAQPG